MEKISPVLLFLSFSEAILMGLMIFSFLNIKILDRRFIITITVVNIIKLIVRSFPVLPLIIILTGCLAFIIFLKYLYRLPLTLIIASVLLTIMIYTLIEGLLIQCTSVLGMPEEDAIPNNYIRLLFFSFQSGIMIFLVAVIRHFKINLQDLSGLLSFEDLEILSDDEINLDREKRVTTTFLLVITFLLIQGLFINSSLLGEKLNEYFNVHWIFKSPYFINGFTFGLNLILLYLLRYLVITLHLERNDIINRIKERNALRLDWEKRAHLHDQNHHLSMLYMLLQLNNIKRAKEYLKGMVGEIQNVDAIIKTGNQALNALIMSKLSRTKQIGITIKIDVIKSLTKMLVKDWELNRIIGNLLDNAIEAIERKTGRRLVELIIEGGEEYNRIEVITHGIVISDKVEARIFQKGYSSKAEAGHGLGLAICKEIVDEYAGEITISKDQEKEYTSFQVLLPVC